MAILVNRYKSKYTQSIQRDTIWGNFIGEGLPRDIAKAKYKEELLRKLESLDITIPQLFSLDNEILGCTCLPQPCHGEDLIEVLEDYKLKYSLSAQLLKLPKISNIKLLISGGRKYSNRSQLFKVLDAINAQLTIQCLIEGGASGADLLGATYASLKCIPFHTEKAEWDLHGKSAGIIRNQFMLDKYQPNILVAFPGNTGTADMVRRAAKHGIPILYSL